MENEHIYQTEVEWTGNKGSGTFDYRAYDRSHVIRIEGKPPIDGSSYSFFEGDDTRHHPSDLFVSAISACHMLWYLNLCARDGIIVMAYVDRAKGIMDYRSDGAGSFREVQLHPEIIVASEEMKQVAGELHDKAKSMCFLARSCNFPVHHFPDIKAL